MKTLSETAALQKLAALKNDFRRRVFNEYEHRAKNCLTCETQGACCTDAHFVNVHITRLESVLISRELKKLSPEVQDSIEKRLAETVETYRLSDAGDTFTQTYACPLFEKGVGCRIHHVKPAACIQHACYENQKDLPPDQLQVEIESKIEKLNEQTYRRSSRWLPLPVWLLRSKN